MHVEVVRWPLVFFLPWVRIGTQYPFMSHVRWKPVHFALDPLFLVLKKIFFSQKRFVKNFSKKIAIQKIFRVKVK